MNFLKSLDNRSFNFKSNEKKNMNSKTMVREFKSRFQLQQNMKISEANLRRHFSTFKDIENPFTQE